MEEILASPLRDLDGQFAAEMRQLNDDLERLQKHDPVGPHPGHPVPSGERRRLLTGFGRVEGLGDAFVLKMRAALDGTTGGGTIPGAWFDPGIRDLPQRRLFVRSLIPTTSVPSGDSVAYVRQTVFTNNAAAVAAGATKPTSDAGG